MEYLVLDFGDVLFYPTTGNWFITPKFKELIDLKNIDINKLYDSIKKNGYILGYNAYTLEDEYYLFREFYKNILENINIYNSGIVNELAYNYAYESDKCLLYNDAKNELEELSNKYKLIMLSDNWPSGIRLLKENDIYKYFKEVYISSIWGSLKKDGVFFYYPIHKYNLNKDNSLFIDDNESVLDVAVSKGLNVLQMDRENKNIKSKYKVINNLKNII